MSAPSSDEYRSHYDEQLHQAYLRAEYVFNGYVLNVGHRHPEFDAWLQQQGYQHYSFITPFNPRSRPLSSEENEARLADLQQLLRAGELSFAPALGRDPAGEWLAETGVFLFDVPAGEVHELARLFRQNAVVEGKLHGVPFLVWV